MTINVCTPDRQRPRSEAPILSANVPKPGNDDDTNAKFHLQDDVGPQAGVGRHGFLAQDESGQAGAPWGTFSNLPPEWAIFREGRPC